MAEPRQARQVVARLRPSALRRGRLRRAALPPPCAGTGRQWVVGQRQAARARWRPPGAAALCLRVCQRWSAGCGGALCAAPGGACRAAVSAAVGLRPPSFATPSAVRPRALGRATQHLTASHPAPATRRKRAPSVASSSCASRRRGCGFAGLRRARVRWRWCWWRASSRGFFLCSSRGRCKWCASRPPSAGDAPPPAPPGLAAGFLSGGLRAGRGGRRPSLPPVRRPAPLGAARRGSAPDRAKVPAAQPAPRPAQPMPCATSGAGGGELVASAARSARRRPVGRALHFTRPAIPPGQRATHPPHDNFFINVILCHTLSYSMI